MMWRHTRPVDHQTWCQEEQSVQPDPPRDVLTRSCGTEMATELGITLPVRAPLVPADRVMSTRLRSIALRGPDGPAGSAADEFVVHLGSLDGPDLELTVVVAGPLLPAT